MAVVAKLASRYPVLIAGAGPVGLALALELAWRGIRCALVEQGDGRVDFPTTNLVNTRTCEHLRRWGLASAVRYRSGFPSDYPRNYVFVTRMNGQEIARFDLPASGDPNSRSPHSPERRIWVSKPFLDPILHNHVKSLSSVDLRYRTRVESFRQDAAKVAATVVDSQTGDDAVIEADYLVGCDGGRSTVRHQLGIRMEGNFLEGQNVAILFRSPELLSNRHGKAVMPS
jgi:2-polyprenyl-6-methoxyphenol hydroxylase-like FAD-dependent oxidoreductase